MKLFLTLLFISTCSIITKAQSLSKEQVKQVTITVEAYKQNLIAYSISGGKDNNKLFERIKSYFLDPVLGTAHVLDFGDLPEGGAENTEVETYLNKIADNYKNRLITVFKSGKILNCKLEEENEKAAVYLLNKTMDYNGKVYVATNVILVSLPTDETDNKKYKILSVQSATYFINKYKEYSCANMVDVRNSDKEKMKMLHDADTLFHNAREPERALIKYIHIAERYPNDNYVKKTMDTCIKSVRDTFFLVKRGDSLLKKEDFPQALYWYKWHQKTQLGKNRSNDVEEKIRSVIAQSAGSLYADAKIKAEKAYSDKNWPEARYHLEQAIAFKPGDEFALGLLQSVKNYDEAEYSMEIGAASRLYSKNEDKNAAEYYKIVKKHDMYHTLSTIQYIKMCLILFTNRSDLTRNEKLADLKTYGKKLNDSLTSETDKEFVDTAKRLIHSILSYKETK